jgi:hypothetical protein
MGGWNYFEESPGAGAYWNGPAHDDGPDYADYAESPEEQFWSEKKRYPRGRGPAWAGEDAPSDSGAGHLYVDYDEPDRRLLHDPGFAEREVDTHPDPDHGRDERKFAHAKTYAESYRRQNAMRLMTAGSMGYSDFEDIDLNDPEEMDHQIAEREGLLESERDDYVRERHNNEIAALEHHLMQHGLR